MYTDKDQQHDQSILPFLFVAGILFWIIMIITGCGTYEPPCTQNCDKATEVVAEPFTIQGSVASAFQVTVDGTAYPDMESYYTSAVETLDAKVAAAGYKGYRASLYAQLGFKDLINGMTVYVQTKSSRGYQGHTLIAKTGSFALDMPPEAAGDTYQMRANKRISVVLTKGAETKKICYNFSAVDFEVPYEAKDKPVVLSNFKSSLTLYACAVDEAPESLPIPDAPKMGTAEPKTDTTDANVPNKQAFLEPNQFGTAGEFTTVSGGRLLTYKTSICSVDSCQVMTNDKGDVYWTDGVKPELLETAGWFATKEDAMKALDDWKETE